MDAQFYKSFKVPRGYTYGYYHRSPAPGKNLPTVVFSHGYPSTSQDWAAQVVYFANSGYGVVAPDLLGYGRTDKPSDLAAYKTAEISKDVASILDHEGVVDKVLLVGHDWGAWVVSRFITEFPNRVLGAAYLSVGYMPPPAQPFVLDEVIAFCQQTFGSDRLGYWTLFATEDGAAIMDKNIDSLYDLLFPADPEIWKEHMAPKDAARNWVSEGRRTNALPKFWDEKRRREHQDAIQLNGGFSTPNKWYLSLIAGHSDDPSFDASKKLTLPVFLGLGLRDYVSLAEPEKQMQKNFVEQANLTTYDFDTGHWVMMEAPDEVNVQLEKFFAGL